MKNVVIYSVKDDVVVFHENTNGSWTSLGENDQSQVNFGKYYYTRKSKNGGDTKFVHVSFQAMTGKKNLLHVVLFTALN